MLLIGVFSLSFNKKGIAYSKSLSTNFRTKFPKSVKIMFLVSLWETIDSKICLYVACWQRSTFQLNVMKKKLALNKKIETAGPKQKRPKLGL
jgi:hypothetical protein